MKFTETAYVNPQKSIVKFPDHYVAMAVTVEADNVAANADGRKIVAAGTIMGGGFIADDTKNAVPAKAASLSTALTGTNNDLVFTAKKNRTIKVAFVDPSGNDKALSIDVTADTITVNLATGPAGAITSTADDIKAAIAADYLANDLVSVADKADNDGSGVVTALVATALTGGVEAEGILLNPIDVTDGDAGGAMLIHGFVAVDKLPAAPSDYFTESLKGRIMFIK